MNKKADLSVIVFVLLTLFLCGTVLYSLNSNKNKVTQIISEYDISEKWLLEQKDLEYRLTKLSEGCIVESFGASGVTYKDGAYSRWIEERSEENFTAMIKKCIKEKAEISYNLLDKSLMENRVKSGFLAKLKNTTDLKVESGSKRIDIFLKEFPISWLNKENTYIIGLKANIILSRIGLIHPQEFKNIIECKEDKICIDLVTKGLFDVQTEEVKISDLDYIRYEIKSKREFLFGNEFKKIDITFLVEKTN